MLPSSTKPSLRPTRGERDLLVIRTLTHDAVHRDLWKMVTVAYHLPMGGLPRGGALERYFDLVDSGIRWHQTARSAALDRMSSERSPDGNDGQSAELGVLDELKASAADVERALSVAERAARAARSSYGQDTIKTPKQFARALALLLEQFEHDHSLEQRLARAFDEATLASWDQAFIARYPSRSGARYGAWLAWLLAGPNDRRRSEVVMRISRRQRLGLRLVGRRRQLGRTRYLFG